jgi:hypothetical protein
VRLATDNPRLAKYRLLASLKSEIEAVSKSVRVSEVAVSRSTGVKTDAFRSSRDAAATDLLRDDPSS